MEIVTVFLFKYYSYITTHDKYKYKITHTIMQHIYIFNFVLIMTVLIDGDAAAGIIFETRFLLWCVKTLLWWKERITLETTRHLV